MIVGEESTAILPSQISYDNSTHKIIVFLQTESVFSGTFEIEYRDVPIWSYRYLITWPGEYAGSGSGTGTSTIYFSASDFEEGEVGGYYTLDVESAAISGSNIDYDTVSVTGCIMWVDGDGTIIDPSRVSYDTTTHKFSLHLERTGTFDGTIDINYSYDTLITYTPFAERFKAKCADLPFNYPTLRQLLTSLMQQVGCIPIVKNGMLGYLDFQKDAVPFGLISDQIDYTLGNTVNYIRRSLSSDSYVNTLVNASDSVLDSGNEVVCETLGFRDSQTVLLKQTENLKLQTSLPIYKINKCIMHAPGQMTGGYVGSNFNCSLIMTNYSDYPDGYNINDYPWPIIFYGETDISDTTASLKFRFSSTLQNYHFTVKVNDFCFLTRNSSSHYSTVAHTGAFNISLSSWTPSDPMVLPDDAHGTSVNFTSKSITYTINSPNNTAFVGFALSGVFVNNETNETKEFTFIRFDKLDTNVQGRTVYGNVWEAQTGTWQQADINWFKNLSFARSAVLEDLSTVCFQDWDITKLVVERSIRQTLETDFVKMQSEISSQSDASVDKLAKYRYGTVEYSIGSKEITGFSEVYVTGQTTGLGWITVNKTYIENMVNCLEKGSTKPISNIVFDSFDFFKLPGMYWDNGTETGFGGIGVYQTCNLVDFVFTYVGVFAMVAHTTNPITYMIAYSSGSKYFANYLFDIYYQPLNSFNMSYVKSDEDISIPLAQYDSGASGLTDFDRLSIHEQEQVDRIGNETLFINQRTISFSDIQTFDNGPLMFRDDTNRDGNINDSDNGVDYIIFKRSFTINNNCFNVSYIGSKAAILKNYFTSIRTKYRAYQYVDYNQSVLRKERDVFYIRIASNFYDGDDRIKGGTNDYLSNFVYDIQNDFNELGYKRNISYELETDIAKVPDSSTSSGYNEQTQTIKNSVSLISSDNTMGFVYEYLDNIGAGPYVPTIAPLDAVGGLPQAYQIWGDTYNLRHQVKFTNYIRFYEGTVDINGTLGSGSDVAHQHEYAEICDYISKIENSPIVDSSYAYTTIFYIVDNNKADDYKRTFYKDYAERINHTIQFIYYASDKDVLINEHFISGTPAINRYDYECNVILSGDLQDFTLSKDPYEYNPSGNFRIIDKKEWYQPDGPFDDETFGHNYINFISNWAYSGIPYFIITWPTIPGSSTRLPVLKLCHYDAQTNTLIDIAAFKRTEQNATGSTSRFFFMINDTKTDWVYTKDYNGILYKRYKVATYTDSQNMTLDREVTDPYSD